MDILENLLSLSGPCCTSVQVRVLPALVQIMQANQHNVAVSGTVQAALDLLQHVLLSVEKHTRALRLAAGSAPASAAGPASPSSAPSAAPEFLHPLLFSELLPLTLALLVHTDDRSLIEVGTTVLTAFLRVDSARVAAAHVSVVLPGSAAGTAPAPVGGLQLLCIIINQFLNPALDDKVAHNVGNLIVQLVFSLGGALGEPVLKDLIRAVVARLHSSTYPPLTESLLMIFARLIHSSGADAIVGFLSSMGSIAVLEKKQVAVKKNPSDKYTSMLRTELVPGSVDALTYLLTRWMGAQAEVHASYPSKVLHTALAKLLSFLFASAEPARAALRNMECRGYVVDSGKGAAAAGKRVTRAQTASTGKSHEPAYTKIPLSTKLLAVLLNEWREWSEQEAARAKKQAKKLTKIAKAQAGGGGGAGLGGDGASDDEYDSEDDYDDDDDDDDDFDEDEDFSDDDDDFIAKIIQQEKNAKARGGAGGAGAGASPFAAAEDFPDFGASKKGGGGGSGAGKQYMTLSDMLDSDDAAELDEELEEEVYPEALTDPLNQLQLGPFIAGFFREFATLAQGAAIKEAAQWLSPSDQKLLEAALAAPVAPTQTTPKK